MATDYRRTIDFGGGPQKVTGLPTPTLAADAAPKSYVDAAIAGLTWKAAVRAATTVTGTLASAFQNAAVIDGVTLATGDRILIKNQSTGGENGIYTVNASGAPTRATDADTGTELVGAAVLVQEGTTQADTQWVNQTNAPITIGTTATVWAQFGAGGGSIARFEQDFGDGAATSYAITHSRGTKAVSVTVYRTTGNFDEIECEVQHTSTTVVTLLFDVAPTTNQYHVVVIG
jgi:phage-related tail fiber protein